MRKRVLVIGEHFSENLGDGVIGQSVEFLIRNSFPTAELIHADLSGRKHFMNEYKQQDVFSVRSKYRFSEWIHQKLNKHTLLYALYAHGHLGKVALIKEQSNQPFDLAVFTGGQLFMDYFSLPISHYMKQLAKNDTPTIFNSCGMGRVNSKWLQYNLKRALSHPNIDSITVRDHIDEINDKLLPSHGEASQSYDCALWAKEAFNVHKKESSVIGLGVISLNNKKNQQIISLYTDIIHELNGAGSKWELFCNGSLNDYELAVKIAQKLGYDKSIIAERPLLPAELVETISSYRSIVSFRLHSHVVAASLGVPSVAIVWDHKVDFFFESIQSTDRLFHYESQASDVLEKLFEAERDGYNTELIQVQKENCRELLISRMALILEADLVANEKAPLSEVEV